jgi:hypothetical protein
LQNLNHVCFIIKIQDYDFRDEGFGVSLFERLERPAVTSVLTLQYRMNSTITRLANLVSYDGSLQCANATVAEATLPFDMAHWRVAEEEAPVWLKAVMSQELKDSVIVLNVTENKVRNVLNLLVLKVIYFVNSV